MAAVAHDIQTVNSATTYKYIVVGTGPVGVRFIQEISKLQPEASIAIFGNEPWEPYNRVQLSSLISGEIKEASLYSAHDISKHASVTPYYNNKIIEIDRKSKKVLDSNGDYYRYDHLILATGSTPYIPNLPGVNLQNVFTFRDLNDAQSLMSRSVRTQKTVIIGGGLLGLEAARAMQRFNTEVHIIEHSYWIMFNQLDERAGSYLKQYVESLGIHIHTRARVEKIIGENKVTGVKLANNEIIKCDTVIIATGITANTELARQCGLNYTKGIWVDDQLKTNDSSIYAVGECAEHNNTTYGLIAPGYEQAAVLAHYLQGDNVHYTGTTASTNLKVLNYPVFSIGDNSHIARQRETHIFQDHEKEIYRKIVVINGRIRSAIGIGDCKGIQRFQEAIEQKRRVWPWQIRNFIDDGILWSDSVSENVIEWPSSATVCNCTGVTRGDLSTASNQGAKTVSELSCATGASTVCGSCKHLLTDFVGGNATPEPLKFFKTITSISVFILLSCMAMLFAPSYSYSNSVITGMSLDFLWRDNFIKQVSGFTLLGLSIFISIISFRKRIKKWVNLWDYSYWRLTHIATAILLVATLFAHTGFNLGNNLNFYLMLIFSTLLLVGSAAGLVIGYEHNLPRRLAKQLRLYAIWSHILLLWPLPPLLGFHILKTYYF